MAQRARTTTEIKVVEDLLESLTGVNAVSQLSQAIISDYDRGRHAGKIQACMFILQEIADKKKDIHEKRMEKKNGNVQNN